MNLLEKINEKYAEELASILPIQRVLLVLLSIPPLIHVLSENHDGVFFSYFDHSPRSVFALDSGLLWMQSWGVWVLMLLVVSGAIFASGIVRTMVVKLHTKSSRKPQYLASIRGAADQIRKTLAETRALEEALQKKYLSKRKSVQLQGKLAELLVSSAFVYVCFISRWSTYDAPICLVLVIAGGLIEWCTYRFYLSSVAPSYLLHGFLTNSVIEMEDGY